MKKIWIAFVATLTLLCGCQANENINASDYGEDIAKAQEIAVVSADTSEVLETITSEEDIEHFVLSLGLDQWKLKALPDHAAEIGSFDLAQEQTIRLGQTDSDGTLYEMATITLYRGTYVGLEIGGLDMTFEVSEDTADYLSGYFE